MRDLRQFWGIRRLANERVGLLRLGSLRGWLAHAEREWAIAEEMAERGSVMDLAQVSREVVPEGLSWTRTFFAEAPRDFQIVPVAPDRPIVIEMSDSVQLSAGESIPVFIKFPVHLEARVLLGKKATVIGRLSGKRLSDTWFGSMEEGMLCYSLPLRAEFQIEHLPAYADWALARVELQNHSRELLLPSKLCLRPAAMQLFSNAEALHAADVVIRYEGAAKGASVVYEKKPSEAGTGLLAVGEVRKDEAGLGRRFFGGVWRKSGPLLNASSQ